MKFKLLTFDFDGTLVDTNHVIVCTQQEAARQLGMRVPTDEECTSTIGLTLDNCFLKLFPDLTEEQTSLCCDTYRNIFNEIKGLVEYAPVLFPGVEETLREVYDRGHVLTIASSRHSKGIHEFLRGFGLDDIFSYVIGGGDTERSKPDPEPVLRTLADLGCEASDTLVVGDMPYDILMGSRAGARTCGVTYGNSSREELKEKGADFVIDSFTELLGIV